MLDGFISRQSNGAAFLYCASRATRRRNSPRDGCVSDTRASSANSALHITLRWLYYAPVLSLFIGIMKMEQNKARDSPREPSSHHTEMLLALLTQREELPKGTADIRARKKLTDQFRPRKIRSTSEY